jgi:hypothetical protein
MVFKITVSKMKGCVEFEPDQKTDRKTHLFEIFKRREKYGIVCSRAMMEQEERKKVPRKTPKPSDSWRAVVIGSVVLPGIV